MYIITLLFVSHCLHLSPDVHWVMHNTHTCIEPCRWFVLWYYVYCRSFVLTTNSQLGKPLVRGNPTVHQAIATGNLLLPVAMEMSHMLGDPESSTPCNLRKRMQIDKTQANSENILTNLRTHAQHLRDTLQTQMCHTNRIPKRFANSKNTTTWTEIINADATT